MTYTTLDSQNTSAGLQVLLTYSNDLTGGLFTKMFLFAFFMIVLLGGYFSRKRTTGDSDFIAFFVIAGIMTTILATLMSMIPGLIRIEDVIICISITAIGILILFASKTPRE